MSRHPLIPVTRIEVPKTDVRAVRRKLRLSQPQFAAKFGFQPATVRNWEQGRTRPDGPARVLLAVIARHPEAVEDALRKAGWNPPSGWVRRRQHIFPIVGRIGLTGEVPPGKLNLAKSCRWFEVNVLPIRDPFGGGLRPAHLLEQFRAIQRAVARLREGRSPASGAARDERGGIIRHTQDSGKSLGTVFGLRRPGSRERACVPTITM
jgi:putative transcriptional regulator